MSEATSDRSQSWTDSPIRVVFAKGGLDAHERGAHVVILGLRDAGFEVVYLGLRATPEQIVGAAIQDDADVIGISSLSGGHRVFVNRILNLLAEAGADPVVVVGGLVSSGDRRDLLNAGVARIFGQGSLVRDIVEFLHEAVAVRRARSAAPGP